MERTASTLGTKVAYVYRQSVTAAELGLVALLIACRGEALGLRMGITTIIGTVAFAVVNHVLIMLVASFASGERARRNLHQIADGLPLDISTARRMTCRSSRTFPGQE